MKDQAKTKEQLIGELAELRRWVTELETVETERKQAEEALRGALAELTVIHQNAPLVMMLVDRDRRVRKVNGAAALFAGRSAEEMLGLRGGEALRCLHHLDDPQGCGFGPACATCTVRLAVLDTFTTRESRRDVEAWLPFPRDDSVEERCLLVSTAYLQMDGTEQVLVCAQDITDRKRAEEALRESGARYRAIVEAFDGLIYVCSQDYRVEFINKQLLERTGYDGTGELCYKVLHDLDSVCPWCVNDRVFAGETVRWEVQSPKDNRWYYVVNTPIYHADGSMSKQAMILDITERKQAEDELRASEARFRTFVDHAADAFFLHDEWGTVLDVNRQACESLGYSREELIGMTPGDLDASIDHSFIEQIKAQLNAGGVVTFDTWSRRKDGSIFPVEVRTRTLWQGERRLAVSLVRDMTERKQMEKALAAQEREFRTLAENSPDNIARYDANCRTLYVNPTLEKTLGRPASEMLGTTPIEAALIYEARKYQEKIAKVFETGQDDEMDLVLPDKGEGVRYQNIRFVAERGTDGTVTGVQTIGRDITQRKQAEVERQAHVRFLESMGRVNRAIQGTNDLEQMMSGVLDIVLSIFDCDRAFLLYPCDPDAPSWFSPMERTRPEYPGILALGMDEASMDAEVARTFRILLDTDGPVKFGPGTSNALPVDVSERFNIESFMSMALYPKVDKPWQFGIHQCSYTRIWTSEDERLFQEIGRRLADALTGLLVHRHLRESEERYRLIAENTADTISVFDLNLKPIYTSPSVLKLRGYTVQEAMTQSLDQVLTPKSLQKVTKVFAEQLALEASGKADPARTVLLELEEYCKDGSTIWVELTASAIRDKDLQPTGILTVSRDINERKQAQEALTLFRSLIDHANDIIEVADAETGRFLDVNERACLAHDYTREEYLALTVPQINAVVAARSWKETVEEVRRSGSLIRESQHRRKDGSIFPVEININYVHLDHDYILSIVRDITERKQAEEALRESEEKYRELINGMNDTAWVIDFEGNFIDVNNAAVEVLGYSREELLSMGPHDIDNSLDAEEIKALIKEMPTDKIQVFETTHTTKDGQVIPVEIKSSLVTYLGKRAILSIARDITQRKQAEEALRQSEERFRALYEDNPSMYFMIDAQGTVLSVNPFGANQLGYTVEELIGQSVLNVFYPDDRKAVQQQLTACLEHPGQVAHWEFRKVRQDGSMLWVREAARAVQGADGRPVVLVVCEDITERRRAEEERERLLVLIQEQAHRVQEVVDTVPEGVLLLDADCRVVLTNPLGQRDLATLAGVQVGDILTHLGDRPLVELLTSPPKGLWHKVDTKNRNFQVLARPVENDAIPKGWVLVVRDVTQQYESERRIQQQQQLAAVGQLAAGIAHDFNNILAVIVLYAQMGARSAALSDRDRGRLVTINEQAQHATRLIQQILDFSRRAVLERQPLDLLPLLKEQVQLLKRTLPEHVAIQLDCKHGEYTVNADPTRMQQMVMNLAVNARDAMPEGGVLSIALERITIELGASLPLPELVAGDWIRLSIADTGIGIPPEVLPHIFEPFYTTKPPDRGSGLGLAQVYGIVAQHEGHIDVETQVGAGTTFIIYLPALEVPSTAPLSPDVSIVPQGKGKMVLVVEDSAPLRATLRETLTEWGYQVREAADGVQALTLLEELGGVADLVLSDVVMPEMGGVALVHALRERGWVMPVILLSGYPQKRDMAKLRAHGVIAWLSKPPSLEELAEVVAQALGTD